LPYINFSFSFQIFPFMSHLLKSIIYGGLNILDKQKQKIDLFNIWKKDSYNFFKIFNKKFSI